MTAFMFDVCLAVDNPAGWGFVGAKAYWQLEFCGWFGSGCGVQPGGGTFALAAPPVLKSTPAEAVESLEAMVLLMRFTLKASSNPTPPPSHPATLFTMMLLVTVTWCHMPGFVGLRCTSVPFTLCKRRPPPL